MRKLTLSILSLALLAGVSPGFGALMYSADQPDSGLVDNSFVDILYRDGIIWMAGAEGLSYSLDLGQTWLRQNQSTGMNADEPSAIFGRPGQIWVATSHFETYQGANYPFGDGFNVTYDQGLTWQSFAPQEASDFARIAYDISGNNQSTYAACFHGGLIASHNYGHSWSHLFFSSADSSDWISDQWADLETGRYYSCLVDTFHADTLIVYGGSAKGVHKFLYVPRRVKLGGNNITSIVASGGFIYLAHENGITQVDTALQNFYTSGIDNGLPGHWIRKLAIYGGRLWAAAFDPADTSGLGLYYCTHVDQPWTEFAADTVGPTDFWAPFAFGSGLFEGYGGGVYDCKIYNDSTIFIAAGDSGVYRSIDSGYTWTRFYVDSTDTNPASLRNQVLSVEVITDTMFMGTPAGLVKAAYGLPFAITYDTLVAFADSDTSGAIVTIVRYQQGDYPFLWVVQKPASASGIHAAVQILDGTDTYLSIIRGTNTETVINDMIVVDSFTTFATTSGLLGNYNVNLPDPSSFVFVPNDPTTGQTLVNYDFQTAAWVGPRLFAGSTGGFGYRVSNTSWRIFRANTNRFGHDLAVARTQANSGLPGDWVVALEIQPRAADTLLWAACRRVPDTVEQTTAVVYSRDFGANWVRVLENQVVWNFAFDGTGAVYAAASAGLFWSPPSLDAWERAEIIDRTTGDTIWAETEVYAVEVVNDILWVGTSFGLAFRPISDPDDWHVIRVFKDADAKDDVFAAPIPFSPVNSDGRLTLHYHVEQSASVTVEIYDFAMNLVAVAAADKYRDGGADYFETWDGYNGEGIMVAAGMYFFRVSYSTGEEYWGRLAIIP